MPPHPAPASSPPSSFGAWLRLYRTRPLPNTAQGRLSQERLAELLEIELGGQGLTGATISNWERGHSHINVRDRRLLLCLVKVLAAQGKITTAAEADQLLQAGHYRPLSPAEQSEVFPYTPPPAEPVPPAPVDSPSALPPSTYEELFGVAAPLAQLAAALPPGQAPWILLITGLGGIGKTALADAVARACLPQFQQVVWVRLKPRILDAFSGELLLHELLETVAAQLWPHQTGPAAQQRAAAQRALKAQPYLVVVDNLELVAETQAMLAQAAHLAHPSKFLLTTRSRPLGAEVFTVALNELPAEAALALLRGQANLTNQPDLAAITPLQFEPIYRVVGGNPLALKLVARLAGFEALPDILAGLQHAHAGAPTTQLYHHIYRKAWQALSPPAQSLLQAMPLIAETGGTREHLAEISALPAADLQAALQELIRWSLLEVRGTPWERRYGIHRLTETFVRLEIIHWPPEPEETEGLG